MSLGSVCVTESLGLELSSCQLGFAWAVDPPFLGHFFVKCLGLPRAAQGQGQGLVCESSGGSGTQRWPHWSFISRETLSEEGI